MGFTPDITEDLPALLSARQKSAEVAKAGVQYDVVISGIGFVFDISSQTPYLRQTADAQKQQIDTSSEAGEQTLDGMWTRSQTSWHYGAGAEFYEPDNRTEVVPSKYRFRDSRGVDVWTPGELTLLPKMDAADTGAVGPVSVCGARVGGEDIWYSLIGSTLRKHTETGTTTYTAEFADPASGLVPAGSRLLAGGPFGIQSCPITGGDMGGLWSQAVNTTCAPYWVKSRIGITRGPALYFVSPAGGDLDAETAHWAHPDSEWRWAGITEAPDAVIAAGTSNGSSAVYAMTMSQDSAGSVPQLSQPFQVAELPPGEEILAVQSYLGTYLGLGTNRGVRIGVLGNNGQVQLGPLVETSAPVTELGARGSFMYAAAGDTVVRVNLEASIDDNLRFPYANDVQVSGTIGSLAFVGVSDRVVVGVSGAGTFVASATEKVPTGWLESGQIRYATSVPKVFRTFDVLATTPVDTTVAVSALVGDVPASLITLANGKQGSGISLASVPQPQGTMGYRLDLNGEGSTPVVDMVSVRAVPVPRRQRLIQYPILLADSMRDAKNRAMGARGYAHVLLDALEALEQGQQAVVVKDLTRPEQFEATIERVEFARVTGPRGGRGNFGGKATVTVRTL